MHRGIAIAICVFMTLVSVMAFAIHLVTAPDIRMAAPAIFYGLCLAALVAPRRTAISLAALFCAAIFVAMGVYATIIAAHSPRFIPLQPILFILAPSIFVTAAVAKQVRKQRQLRDASGPGVVV